jgi:hypothetical protein
MQAKQHAFRAVTNTMVQEHAFRAATNTMVLFKHHMMSHDQSKKPPLRENKDLEPFVPIGTTTVWP